MGRELGLTKEPPHPQKLSEVFREAFPLYLALGMTYDQFYRDDVCLVVSYRKADEIKRRRDNERLWLQGAYIYEALLDASPIFNPYAKRGTKPLPYREEPYPLSKAEAEEREEQKAKGQFLKMFAATTKWADTVNKLKEGTHNAE